MKVASSLGLWYYEFSTLKIGLRGHTRAGTVNIVRLVHGVAEYFVDDQ